MKSVNTSDPSLWTQEYEHGGIPSSVRDRPSNVVLEFYDFLKMTLPQARTAADIGCGGGRNSLFLAKQGFNVTSMDYAERQIDRIRTEVQRDPKLRITAICQDVTRPWPLADESLDVAIDCFCFKHQIDLDGIKNYISELSRTLRPGGYFLLFLATKGDGYYKNFATDWQDGAGTIIIDPANGIASRLYDSAEITSMFGRFAPTRIMVKAGANEMHGVIYERESLAIFMKKI